MSYRRIFYSPSLVWIHSVKSQMFIYIVPKKWTIKPTDKIYVVYVQRAVMIITGKCCVLKQANEPNFIEKPPAIALYAILCAAHFHFKFSPRIRRCVISSEKCMKSTLVGYHVVYREP